MTDWRPGNAARAFNCCYYSPPLDTNRAMTLVAGI